MYKRQGVARAHLAAVYALYTQADRAERVACGVSSVAPAGHARAAPSPAGLGVAALRVEAGALPRAVAVVRYLASAGVPQNRMVAAGFGEFFPVASGGSAEALRQNRRIEIKLTDR